jgi:carbon storage regulator
VQTGLQNANRKEPIMPVLTRKLNEQIIIGQQRITIKVVDVRGGRVRLGIEAPSDIRIERGTSPASSQSQELSREAVCS